MHEMTNSQSVVKITKLFLKSTLIGTICDELCENGETDAVTLTLVLALPIWLYRGSLSNTY